jgi:hypothetical protein
MILLANRLIESNGEELMSRRPMFLIVGLVIVGCCGFIWANLGAVVARDNTISMQWCSLGLIAIAFLAVAIGVSRR